jgi:hypothetical protein
MRIETSLKKRDELKQAIQSLYSVAIICKMDHDKLNTDIRSIFAKYRKCPQWVIAYCEGADSVMRDMLYRDHLEYCSIAPSGEVLSHNSKSERYYQKRGFSPSEWSNVMKQGGHYWRDTNKVFYVK